MRLSVEAALQLAVFNRTTVRVYAGQENLTRVVRWVHPVEISDIAQFLTGGELLLTAGLGVGRTATEQRRYLREISAAGAAALVIELAGRVFTTMPAALIDEAERLHFPLIGLTNEVPFVEVSAQVHGLLADMNTSDLVAFERLNDEFIRLLLASSSSVSLTEALAHHVGHPAVLEDAEHRVVAYAGGTAEVDQLMKNWGLHGRMGHHGEEPGGRRRSDPAEQTGCSRRMVVLRGEAWGWIHVFNGSAGLSTAQSYALDRAADAVAITLLSDRERGARSSQRQSSLVNRLLLGDLSGQQFIDRALRIGRDLRDRPLAVVVLSKDPDGDTRESALETLLSPLRVPTIVADIGDYVLAVVGLATQLSIQRLTAHLTEQGVRAGVSRSAQPDQLRDATRQARTAASVASTRDQPIALAFDRLGVLRLLVALADGPELSGYVEDELGPLLAHDASYPNPLLPTLRAFLAHDANKSRAADALFVQRRTLYYRIDRLSQILGRSLYDAEVRANLALAIRAHDFLESTAPTVLG
jgi:PucR family transcriptional regulator, purine catabolism regulatory protein